MIRAEIGQSIAKGGELGVVDMRQITPALARLLPVRLPDAYESHVRTMLQLNE
jgi:hypothetical protein